VGDTVIIQFRVAEVEVAARWVVFRCRKFAMKLVRTYIGRVLIPHAAGIKGFVGNRDGVFARFGFPLTNCKSVLAEQGLGLKTDELDNDVVTHEGPETASLVLTETLIDHY
jgi:hypothetical protein